jgi:hypothetical protein
MSHRSWSALFFVLASFAVISIVHAQQPNDDAVKSQQPQSQAEQSPAAQTESSSNHSETPSPPAAASNSKPAAGSSQSVTTIVVNGGPSADILRSARNAGFTVKIANGKTHFCKTEAPIGTRFVSERCMNEQQVTLFLERSEDQREKLSHILGAPANSR